MALATVPYNFVNGESADGDQVDANFAAITNQLNGNVDSSNLSPQTRAELGLSTPTSVRRGKSIQADNGVDFTATVFTLAPLPCKVTGLVCDQDALLRVTAKAFVFKRAPTGVGPLIVTGLAIVPTGTPMTKPAFGRLSIGTTTDTVPMQVNALGPQAAISQQLVVTDSSSDTGLLALPPSPGGNFNFEVGHLGEIVLPMQAGTWDVGLIYTWFNGAGVGRIAGQKLYCEVTRF